MTRLIIVICIGLIGGGIALFVNGIQENKIRGNSDVNNPTVYKVDDLEKLQDKPDLGYITIKGGVIVYDYIVYMGEGKGSGPSHFSQGSICAAYLQK